MRTIDADALNVKLDFYIAGCDLESKKDQTTLTIALGTKKIVNKMPTIDPPANWTPCSVALPEDGENKSEFEYDCTLSNGISEYRWVARLQRIYCGEDGYQWIDSKGYQVTYATVTAWMRKPEPYRGEVE